MCYQTIINFLNNKDYDKFSKMKMALNSFKYDINNKIIEGTNSLIKCLKRLKSS